MILAPEKFQFGASNMVSSYYGSEFILTRAIDRPVLYRAKAALLYLIALLIPLAAIFYSLKTPDLVVSESSKIIQEQCLTHVPGSVLLPVDPKRSWESLISIPHGNVLAAEWQFWFLIVGIIMLQLLFPILYPFKYGSLLSGRFISGSSSFLSST